MESPKQVIQKHCEHKGTDPIDCLSVILGMLQSKLLMADVVKGTKAGRSITLEQEIEGKLLPLIGELLKPRHGAALVNVKLAADHGNQPEAERRQRKVNAIETTLLIIRDLINQAEHQGINASLALDGMTDEDGNINLDEPPEDPNNPPQ